MSFGEEKIRERIVQVGIDAGLDVQASINC
jgi:hypothetical protein